MAQEVTGEGQAVAPGAALAEVTAAVDAALAAAWWQLGEAGVRDAVVELERQAARFDAARLRLLAEAETRDVGAASGALDTAAWLTHATGCHPRTAPGRIRLDRSAPSSGGGAPHRDRAAPRGRRRHDR